MTMHDPRRLQQLIERANTVGREALGVIESSQVLRDQTRATRSQGAEQVAISVDILRQKTSEMTASVQASSALYDVAALKQSARTTMSGVSIQSRWAHELQAKSVYVVERSQAKLSLTESSRHQSQTLISQSRSLLAKAS